MRTADFLTNTKTFSWWKLKQAQTRNKITVYIKSGKCVLGDLRIFVDFFFFFLSL